MLSGNGKIGIMIFGNPLNDTVIFTANNFYYPKTSGSYLPDISSIQDAVKDYILAGKYREAAQLQLNALLSGSAYVGGEGGVHSGYKMLFNISQSGNISNYLRACNFETGEIIIQFSDNRGSWERKSFVSRADSCAVMLIAAPTNGKINLTIQLSSDMPNKPSNWTFTQIIDTAFLNMRVKYQSSAGDQGYEGVTRIIQKSGTQSVSNNSLIISNADTLILLTKLNRYTNNCTAQFNLRMLQSYLSLLPTDYSTLLSRHIAIHGTIYNRVKLDLCANASDRALSNESLLQKQINAGTQTPIKALWERVFDASRYYYLSASCSLTPPMGVGIWTGDFSSEWGGFYHTDANLNLTVGGGNIGNMPEAMEGYFKLIEEWLPDWKYNATRIHGCRGYLCDGQGPAGEGNGIEGDLNIDWPYQYFTGRMGWLIYPFVEYYQITGDKNFLQKRLYPILKEMCYFYEDFLKRTDNNGKYIFVGSISPENTPSNSNSQLSINSTIDIASAKFILKSAISASKDLNVEQGPQQGIERWTAILNKLPPYLINSDGALKEWAWQSLNDNYNHRHISHLVTVWPFKEINPEETPHLISPALKAVQLRGYEDGSGHGILMRALVGAGLKEKNIVFNNLMRFFTYNYFFSNLFSSHNPNLSIFWSDIINTFQTVIMEMLFDSKPQTLELLPALPDQLDTGTITDLKAKCRVTIEKLSWNLNKKVCYATIKSDIDKDLKIICRRGIATLVCPVTAHSTTPAQDSIARIISLKANQPISIVIGFVMGAVSVDSNLNIFSNVQKIDVRLIKNSIHITLPQKSKLKLDIFSLKGEKLLSLKFNQLEKGKHQIDFGNKIFSSGFYIIKIQNNEISYNLKYLISNK